MRNGWRLTQTKNCLILLLFVSYEAVRLWWWGGSNGVMEFEKYSKACSIPILASNSNCVCSKGFVVMESNADTKTDTSLTPP
jgi:hypothetical protein